MSSKIRIALAQTNFLLGDIEGNTQRICEIAAVARDTEGADIVVFPELAITSYPPEDLLLRPECHRRVAACIEQIQQTVKDIHLVVGHPHYDDGSLYNAASVIFNGEIIARYYKQHLPNYSVFDEKRYFMPGDQASVLAVKGIHLGLTICEDLWQSGPLADAKEAGADVILCLNASPFHSQKIKDRQTILQRRQKSEGALPIVYVNLVGGQDELVFDGSSMVIDQDSKLVHLMPQYEEVLSTITVEKSKTLHIKGGNITPPLEKLASIYQALVTGTRDYIRKNGFKQALIGLSGGIDSALTAVIAADALGTENVDVVLMPSRYTATMSIDDAQALAENLNLNATTISIEPAFEAFLSSLETTFEKHAPDVTEENIQARCRGVLLMAMSNKLGKLVLTTGNKSEMAVGYATLYGDMAGSFAVLKDVSKTLVYALSTYRNQLSAVIPQRSIDRPPSAELATDQTDQDSLPDYDMLDPIMTRYVELDESATDIVAAGYNPADVEKVICLIDRNEYKRRQAPPGIRISKRAFGRDWRYPITSGFLK